jgi:hypothetical protein
VNGGGQLLGLLPMIGAGTGQSLSNFFFELVNGFVTAGWLDRLLSICLLGRFFEFRFDVFMSGAFDFVLWHGQVDIWQSQHKAPWHKMMMSLPLTTTRLAMGVLSHAGDLAKLKEDKNEVCHYVKDTLFEWAVFVWNKTAIKKKLECCVILKNC